MDLEGFQPGGRAPAPPPLDLVQDFVNTEIPDFAHDALATPHELAAWLGGRGLLAADEPVAAELFVAARELRSLLRSLALLNTLGVSPDEALRARFDSALDGVVLRPLLDADGSVQLAAPTDGASRALAAIVAVVVEAQAAGSWRRMKACRKDGCGWLFYDGSRNCSSSWCSMSICGNRTKTTAYRRRRSARG
jgi:predicted RNA-binding Zn ribbon-like protein